MHLSRPGNVLSCAAQENSAARWSVRAETREVRSGKSRWRRLRLGALASLRPDKARLCLAKALKVWEKHGFRYGQARNVKAFSFYSKGGACLKVQVIDSPATRVNFVDVRKALLGLGEGASSSAEAQAHLRRCNELFDAMPANGSVYERRKAQEALRRVRDGIAATAQ